MISADTGATIVRKRKVVDNDPPVIAPAYQWSRVAHPDPGGKN
jgi:hypothetical protein